MEKAGGKPFPNPVRGGDHSRLNELDPIPCGEVPVPRLPPGSSPGSPVGARAGVWVVARHGTWRENPSPAVREAAPNLACDMGSSVHLDNLESSTDQVRSPIHEADGSMGSHIVMEVRWTNPGKRR